MVQFVFANSSVSAFLVHILWACPRNLCKIIKFPMESGKNFPVGPLFPIDFSPEVVYNTFVV